MSKFFHPNKITAHLILVGIIVVIFTVSSLEAQYFGRNKVQYQDFDFRVMKTLHFDIYFYLEQEDVVKEAGLMAERWYARLSRLFNHELKGRQALILYGSGPEFQQTTVISGSLGEGTGGVTESFKRRIVLPYGASLAETDHVIGHELIHAFQFDIMAQGHSDDARQSPQGLMRIPLWFVEGMAEYLSIGPEDPLTAMWMRDAVRSKDLPLINKMDSFKYFPYRYGHAFWAYVTGRWGDDVVGKIMKAVGRAGNYEPALEALLRVDLKQLSTDWHTAMQEAYAPVQEKTKTPAETGRSLFPGTEMNPYNVAPSLSPDGTEIIFLSTRNLFSVDLFLADAQTGKIKRKLTSTAVDPHFESIQFIKSSGSWNAEGDKFVFGAVSRGRPHLVIVDVQSGRTDREIPFTELGEIVNPTWSPDGRFIAFSALASGTSDLFIYELETNILKQMTRDSFADLQPAWSPDGKTIAFVTDRFTTNLEWMDIGHYEIALLDPSTGAIERLLAFPDGKNINPQWSSDSGSLYFISDQGGKSDVYRLDLADRRIHQVTNLYTGVAGITELSPAISTAIRGQALAYSAYEDGKYSIFAVDTDEALAGTPFIAQFEGMRLAVLPPRTQPEGTLLGLLKNPLFGLPKETDFPVSDYKPRLTLDYLSQPQVAVGVDRYGSFGAGGIAAFWSDMLGYHTVVTVAQVNNRLIDSAFQAAYLNNRKRWNWGVVGQRMPYVYGSYGVSIGQVFGEPAYIEQEILFRQINYEISGFAFYPFNTARRLELNAGVRLLDFNTMLYTRAYSLFDDFMILNEKERLPSSPSLYFGTVSASMVYDTGIFGATSPILGQSYLLQVTPTLGSLAFTTVLADYRRYIMPVRPITLAFRAIHYGRYGKDAEDGRLWPLFIGYENLVRGYNDSSFSYFEFSDAGGFTFDRLIGSKMALANFEVRFPLFGLLGLGKGFYGVWPLEAFAFYDIGVAWREGTSPSFLGGKQVPVSSVGTGLRTNLFGYLVLGLNYVKPLDRPERGWYFQFTISPGF
ncbi:MAG: peptidase S9 [Acidobacteriota bacterium]|nr:peptidase S9 [Acidobacteriota bacterium]